MNTISESQILRGMSKGQTVEQMKALSLWPAKTACCLLLLYLIPVNTVLAQREDDTFASEDDPSYFDHIKEQKPACTPQVVLYNVQTKDLNQTAEQLRTTTGEARKAVKKQVDQKTSARKYTYNTILKCAQGGLMAIPEESRLKGDEAEKYKAARRAAELSKLIEAHQQILDGYDEIIKLLEEEQAELARLQKEQAEASMKFILDVANGDFFKKLLEKESW